MWIGTKMGDDNQSDDTVRRRKLDYRANHRGMKEMDIVLGGYVSAHIDAMSSDELNMLEQIIDIPDVDLLSWITGRQRVPQDQHSALLDKILAVTVTPEDYSRA